MNLIRKTIATSQDMGFINKAEFRNLEYILRKVTEEQGELSDEIIKYMNARNNDAMEEAIDLTITLIDFYSLVNLEEKKLESDKLSELLDVMILDKSSLNCSDRRDDTVLELITNIKSIISSDHNILHHMLNINSLVGHLSVAVQIELNQTYKTAEMVSNLSLNDHISELLVSAIVRSLNIIQIITSDMSPDETIGIVEKVWSNKINKWREKRGFEVL